MEIPMANDKIILKAEDLDGYLTNEDLNDLKHMDELFKETMKSFEPKNEEKIIQGYDLMGHEMQKICKKHPNIKVYSKPTKRKKIPVINHKNTISINKQYIYLYI